MKHLKSFKFLAFCLVFLYTVFGFFIVPWFVTQKLPFLLKEKESIHLEIKKAKFNPYNFKLDLSGLKLYDLKNKEVAYIKNVLIDFSPLSFFNGVIFFKNIQINLPSINIQIDKNGALNLSKILPTTDSKNSKTQSKELPFVIKIQKVEIDDGKLIFSDLRRENFKIEFSPFRFIAQDISTKKGALGGYRFFTKIDGISELNIEGGIKIASKKCYGEVNLINLNLPKLYDYFEINSNIKLKESRLSLYLPYKIGFKDDFLVKIDDANIELIKTKLENRSSKKEIARVDNLKMEGIDVEYPKQNLAIKNILLSRVSLNLHMDKEYRLDIVKLFETSNSQNSSSTTKKAWRYNLNNIAIKNSFIKFIDASSKKPIESRFKNLYVSVKSVSSNIKKPIEFNINSELNKKTKLKVKGEFFQDQKSIFLSVLLNNLNLAHYRDYLNTYINFDLKSANFSSEANIDVNFKKDLKLKIDADSHLKNLNVLKNKEKLIGWKDLSVNKFKFNLDPLKIDIESIYIQNPYLRAHIAKNGVSNFNDLLKNNNKTESKETKKHLNIRVESIKLSGGSTDFSDFSLPFPFKTHMHDLNGKFTTLDFATTTPSILKIDGKIDKYGYANIDGVLYPFDIKDNAELNLLFKNIDLSSLTPYSGKFLGYTIKDGKLSMDLKYRIKDAKLVGENKINIDKLTLGKKVESKDAMNLPLELALALLKDSNDQIDLDLPVSGDINNPEFSYSGVILKALGNMITGIVTAPFRFLGSVLGIDADNLKSIDFEKGSYKIISTEVEKFENLKKILKSRPQIKLNIFGAYDQKADKLALQKIKLEEILDAKMNQKSAKKIKNIDTYGLILKEMYIEKFGGDEFEKIKKFFLEEAKQNGKKVDIINLNKTLQNKLSKEIKVTKGELKKLAKNRAKAVKETLINRYSIESKRVVVKGIKAKSAKRDRLIQCDLEISL